MANPEKEIEARFASLVEAFARNPAVTHTWCSQNGLADLAAIEPVHAAAYVEQLQERLAAPMCRRCRRCAIGR